MDLVLAKANLTSTLKDGSQQVNQSTEGRPHSIASSGACQGMHEHLKAVTAASTTAAATTAAEAALPQPLPLPSPLPAPTSSKTMMLHDQPAEHLQGSMSTLLYLQLAYSLLTTSADLLLLM
jgi:hypothetical protein